MKQLKDLMSFNSDTFSTLHHLLFEEPCPNCGVLIQKNGGCKHMVCGKCKYEFCWLCLGSYYSYSHDVHYQHVCPQRYVMVIGAIVLLCLFLNYKLCYGFELIYLIQYNFIYTLAAGVVIDLHVFSLVIYR